MKNFLLYVIGKIGTGLKFLYDIMPYTGLLGAGICVEVMKSNGYRPGVFVWFWILFPAILGWIFYFDKKIMKEDFEKEREEYRKEINELKYNR